MKTTLFKEKDIVLHRNPDTYCRNPVVDLLQNSGMIVACRESSDVQRGVISPGIAVAMKNPNSTDL
ncbi:MAG: hypothetical protein HY360_15595 [Verrucomicrobia bacterium]|nr:hypothetical protein [Verrucomicrobiota bacterium]